MKFRKKPVVIEAVQLTWANWDEICDFACVGKLSDGNPEGKMDGESIGMLIPTLEGLHEAAENDWIIRGVKGELYPCKPDIFDMAYSPVGDEETAGTELRQWQRFAAYCRCCALGKEDSVMDFDAFSDKEGIAGVRG